MKTKEQIEKRIEQLYREVRDAESRVGNPDALVRRERLKYHISILGWVLGDPDAW